MVTNTARNLAACLLLAAIHGCSHPLEVRGTGEGDIDSASGTRDCSLEDYQAGLDNCAINLVAGDYDETYTAEARSGSLFHRWSPYCADATTNTCSFSMPGDTVQSSWGSAAPPLQAIFRKVDNTGFDALLIGHSFFDPMARAIRSHAIAAGFSDHTTARFFSGGATGAPMALWNNATLRPQIQAVLDGGDIDVFGMTWYPTYPEIDGYRNWVTYALGRNPDTRFFIAMPWVTTPAALTREQYESAYNSLHANVPHQLVDALRAEFPGVDFYAIPYGQAAVELRNLWHDGTLSGNGDVTALTGGETDAIFTDSLGHPGDILEELSTLIWLRAIYGVDLSTYSYTSVFTTDLKAIAQAIMDAHDTEYDAPPETLPDSDGDNLADRYDPDDDNDGLLDGDDPCPLDAAPGCAPI